MCEIRKFISWLIVAIYASAFVDSACVIGARDKLPLFMKDFGSKKIMLPKDFGDIQLDSGESIEAYCTSGISLKTEGQSYLKSEQGITGIKFFCNSTNLTFAKIDYDEDMPQSIEQFPAYISCEKPVQQIYETKDELPNCEDYSSYAVGITTTEQPNIVTAGICYDLETLSVKYVTYMAHRSKYMVLDQKSNSTQLPINLEAKLTGFKELFRFVSHDTFNKSFATKKTKNPLLLLQDYDYTSIIQQPTMLEELKDYEHMFNVIWWRNLRLGNWYYFMKALERRAEKISYTVYTGTSGILSTPITACERYEELAVKADDTLIRAPQFIWTYLKSEYEELVIVGFNSAFIGSRTPAFRCKDVCNEHDWIAKSIFGRTHSLPTLGLVYCCRVEEVANKLENFPIKVTKSKPIITNSTSEAEYSVSIKVPNSFKNRTKTTQN